MEKEHKYRAWCNEKKRYADGCTVYDDGSWEYYLIEYIKFCAGDGEVSYIPTEKDRLEQYTGLQDKNGKKVYEGDILKQCNGSINCSPWMDDNYTVEWTPKGYNLLFFMWDKEGNECMDSTHWCEIIGNIHEAKS